MLIETDGWRPVRWQRRVSQQERVVCKYPKDAKHSIEYVTRNKFRRYFDHKKPNVQEYDKLRSLDSRCAVCDRVQSLQNSSQAPDILVGP